MIDGKKKIMPGRRALHAFIKALYVFSERLGKATVYDIGKARGLKYQRKIRYCDDRRPYLNLCYGEDAAANGGKRPVLFYIHGGGFVSGRPEFREAFVSKFAAAGYFTVSVFYGLAPRYTHPAPIENVYNALAWTAENAERFSLDLDRLFLCGDSAGAMLAATAAAISSNAEYKELFRLNAASRDCKCRGVILNCGIYDVDKALQSGFPHIRYFIEANYGGDLASADKDSPNYAGMSPERFITEAFPPTMVITAERDKLTAGGRAFYDGLVEKGVHARLFHGKGSNAVHAFPVAQMFKISREAADECVDFADGLS
ncbi:MAG: alpha/beta hydrolase [Clostridiales bacterium]|jgi:acetyl esterase/lipase|nr:alpha/beta hydrolase [Clostridiales bacterium]